MPPTIRNSEKYRGAVVVVVTAMMNLEDAKQTDGQSEKRSIHVDHCLSPTLFAYPTIPKRIGVNRWKHLSGFRSEV
jgi:hypothetical protein